MECLAPRLVDEDDTWAFVALLPSCSDVGVACCFRLTRLAYLWLGSGGEGRAIGGRPFKRALVDSRVRLLAR